MNKYRFMWKVENGASFWIMRGLSNALKSLGHEFYFWDSSQVSAFKAFSDIEPDVVLLQNYNLDNAQIKCCNQRPNLRVIIKSGFFGDFAREYKDKFDTGPFCEQDHLEKTLQIKNCNMIFGYGIQPEYILGNWIKYGKKLWGFLPAADTETYYKVEPKEEYKSDILYVGGYWLYKKNLQWLLKLSYPIGKYNIKLAGGSHWPHTNYIGNVREDEQLLYQSSALINPNVSEPHATDIPNGFEINERVFKLGASQCFVISDWVSDYRKIFTEEQLILCKTFEEFNERVDYFLKNPDERLPYIKRLHDEVMLNHTYKNRVEELLGILNG